MADADLAEWEFIQGLQYHAQTGEDADFVRMMYTVRLNKVCSMPSQLSGVETHRFTSSSITTRWQSLANDSRRITAWARIQT